MKLIFRGKVVIADVNEDAGEKLAKEFNVNTLFKIVINNAAITDIENGMLKYYSLEEPTHFSKLIEINLMGTLAFQYLKQNNPQGGIIINTDGFNHCNTSGVYFWCYSSDTNAKAGVRHYFTKSMSQVSELHNITINAACPSVTRTEMTAGCNWSS
ncbi:unnamed protein product [Rhizophagus irregularis]|nr:unnamed protein product [Rhizophagus irregularis]